MVARSLDTCLLSLLLVTIATAEQPPWPSVDFGRNLAPILAANCYECHGPDAAHREAGLRLDSELSATTPLASGVTAVVAGSLADSALWQRINHDDPDERMPPRDANKSLTAEQRALIQRWIEQGARWSQHWSFTRATRRPAVPAVPQATWPANSIDRFILTALEQQRLTPAPDADRYTLIRRLYLDLIGLPPSPQAIEQYLRDDSPDAYAQLVDRLLASPHYGERWGRHWLDVARYGDSNGGDENHAYPLAYRYRDYVIAAWNADLPYDRFIREQIAGDLLCDAGDAQRSIERAAATGFLAIGMKILAERDPVKKRADMVDEQIDTVGRAMLGLSLGCARCHDHKFDPVTTADYYALAGIFHSTDVADRPVQTPEYQAARGEYDRRRAELMSRRKMAELLLEQDLGTAGIQKREAEQFDRGNVVVDTQRYGHGIGIISDPGGQTNFVEYDFELENAGEYVIQLRYAAAEPRPGLLKIDGIVLREDAMAQVTGGWQPEHQRWITEATSRLEQGRHTLRLESQPMMVHIDRWRIVLSGSHHAFDEIAGVDKSLAELAKRAPQPVEVMSVADGAPRNVQLHVRGSHLDLGDEVPRGFIESLSPRQVDLPADQSGRRELAQWLGDDRQGAGFLAARVMVNRIWHWHFGRGLVPTPDDFGIRGERPTHPELLDYLTHEFIDSGWSMKALHRRIVTSRTYRMRSRHPRSAPQSVDPSNVLHWRFPSRRLEPEVLRDAMLQLSDQLDHQLYGPPPTYKSQDPSPQDLANNRASYESSFRRSVYLPVVRTNVYEFFTLFDFPNASSPVGRRDETTVPTQALFLMNSPYVARLSRAIVRRWAGADEGPPAVRQLYLAIVGREPTAEQTALANRFIERYRQISAEESLREHAADNSAEDALIAWVHTLLMSNQFVYLP